MKGGKTEPKYFKELREAFRLSSANIEIAGDECGSSPRNVVNYALAVYRKQKKHNRIFCVFDKDRHPTYNEALAKIRDVKLIKGDSIQAITSVPCFEIWLLLHFIPTTKAFVSKEASDSICASVIKELVRRLPGYTKGMDNLFPALLNRLPTAIKNAKQLAEHGVASGSDNPSTQMHYLVEYLRDLKKYDETKETDATC